MAAHVVVMLSMSVLVVVAVEEVVAVVGVALVVVETAVEVVGVLVELVMVAAMVVPVLQPAPTGESVRAGREGGGCGSVDCWRGRTSGGGGEGGNGRRIA